MAVATNVEGHGRGKQTVNRAGLNEREAPGEVMTAGPPKRLAQLSSVSHTLVSP